MVYILKHCRTLGEVLIPWNYCIGDPCRLFCVSKPLFLIYFYLFFPLLCKGYLKVAIYTGLQSIDEIYST